MLWLICKWKTITRSYLWLNISIHTYRTYSIANILFRIVAKYLERHFSGIPNLHLISNDILLIVVKHMIRKLKTHRNICTHTLSTKYNRSIHVSYYPHFCNWSCGLRWYLELPSSTTHSVFLLPSASTSAGLRSFHGEVTHTFIPYGSVSFIIFPGLDCYSFPLILVRGHSSIKRYHEGSPAFQT